MNISVKGLTFGYEKETVLRDVSFEIKQGSFLGIVGHNGSGKSTLVKCLLNKNKVANDIIHLNSVDINHFNGWNRVGYVPQKFNHFNYGYPITVREILRSAFRNKFNDSKIEFILKRIGMFEFIDQDLNNLSGGQQQRVFIARALINDPELLILDEPLVGIDKENVEILYSLLKELNNNGMTIILITHNTDYLDKTATHILSLSGEVIYFGEAEKFNHKLCDLC
jgi:zinc transport system ATP-binding protein